MDEGTRPSIEQMREWLADESMAGYALVRRSPWPGRKQAAELLRLIVKSAEKESRQCLPHVHYQYVVQMFWRSRRLYEAALVLLDNAQPEEAAVLARSLFEEAMRLMELDEDESKRDARIIGWANDSLQRKFDLWSDATACGIEDDPAPSVTLLQKARARVQLYAVRHGVTRFERFSSVKNAAFKFDRKEDYWVYSFAHQATHGNDGVWVAARRERPEGGVILNAKTEDAHTLSMIADFAIQAMFDSMTAAYSILGWTLPPGAAEKLEEYAQAGGMVMGDEE